MKIWAILLNNYGYCADVICLQESHTNSQRSLAAVIPTESDHYLCWADISPKP